MSWNGHLWTIAPRLRDVLGPPPVPPSRRWTLPLEERAPGGQPVSLTGQWHEKEGAAAALILVHGLGGSVESGYMRAAATAARRAGLSCLRLNLRGADRQGNDLYHAGLSSDLHAALESRELDRYAHLLLLGFSLGGHLVLRAATEELDPRVGAVAAVCAPLDLAPGADALDRSRRWLYRRYVLASLVDHYRSIAVRRPVDPPVDEARRIRRIREWDEKIVAPRFGFTGADDYYRRASVAPRLGQLRTAALWLGTKGDPMVPAPVVEAALARRPSGLEVHWATSGGHVGFPAGFHFGLDGEPGLASQVIAWLLQAAEESSVPVFPRAPSL